MTSLRCSPGRACNNFKFVKRIFFHPQRYRRLLRCSASCHFPKFRISYSDVLCCEMARPFRYSKDTALPGKFKTLAFGLCAKPLQHLQSAQPSTLLAVPYAVLHRTSLARRSRFVWNVWKPSRSLFSVVALNVSGSLFRSRRRLAFAKPVSISCIVILLIFKNKCFILKQIVQELNY